MSKIISHLKLFRIIFKPKFSYNMTNKQAKNLTLTFDF